LRDVPKKCMFDQNSRIIYQKKPFFYRIRLMVCCYSGYWRYFELC